MTSLKREDNTKAIVEEEPACPMNEKNQEVDRAGLDGSGYEEIEKITGHELDEPENEEVPDISGPEPDETGSEKRAEVTEDDLDAPVVPEIKSFADNELNRSNDKQSKTYREKKFKFKGIKKKFGIKRTLLLFLVAGACLLVGGSYYFFQHKNGEKIISRNNIFRIPDDKSFIFESFILPIQNKQGYTYISLNLLVELSNIRLKGEIEAKKEQLRGIIYDVLAQEIHRVEDADALEKLKTLIIKRANTVLTSGEVREAFITNFMLV